MSRIRILALFAILAALATTFAACGDDDESSSGGGGGDPQQLLDNAGLEGVKSGELEMSMHVTAKGENAGEFEVNLSGPFEQGAKGELPQLDMTLDVEGSAEEEDVDFDGRLTLLTDRAFVEYKGTAYEVDPTTFGFMQSALEQSQQQGGKEDITACQKAAEGIKFSQFADNLQSEGGADVGGTETTKVSGDVDVSGFLDVMFKLTESPACASQLEAAGSVPKDDELQEARSEVVEAVKESHLELYVGEDEIVRKMKVEMTVAPEKADGKVEMELEATLTGVNEEQSFSPLADAKPLEALFEELGVNPLELLEAGGGEGLSGLLEGLTGGSVGGGSPSGGGSSELGGSADQKAYVDCLQKAKTSADLQKCASLLQ